MLSRVAKTKEEERRTCPRFDRVKEVAALRLQDYRTCRAIEKRRECNREKDKRGEQADRRMDGCFQFAFANAIITVSCDRLQPSIGATKRVDAKNKKTRRPLIREIIGSFADRC